MQAWSIILPAGGLPRRRSRLTSNVRPPNKPSSALSRENRMHEWLASTKPPKTTNSSGPLSTGAQEAEKPRSRNAVNMAPIASKAVSQEGQAHSLALKRSLPHSQKANKASLNFEAQVLKIASLARSQNFKTLACSQRWPNPSVEARPNGKAARPAPGCAYHSSAGRATSPSAPPHLER